MRIPRPASPSAPCVLAAITLLCCSLLPAAAFAGKYPVAPNIAVGIAIAATNPSRPPPGVNRPDCRLTDAHPYPVVLVPGTFANMEDDFGALGPELANAGYCVYSLNYGGPPGAFIQSVGPLAASGQQVAAFINQTLTETGAAKADLVGHSQGGTLIEYYAKILNGAPNVNKLVALAPSTHGTTLDGLAILAQAIPGANDIVRTACPACRDQEKNSPFINLLNQGPIAQRGVDYTIIDTRYDFVVTPTGRAAFVREPGVYNVYVQSFCRFDFVDHADLSYDQATIRLVKNALDPSSARAPICFFAFPAPAH